MFLIHFCAFLCFLWIRPEWIYFGIPGVNTLSNYKKKQRSAKMIRCSPINDMEEKKWFRPSFTRNPFAMLWEEQEGEGVFF